MRLLFHRFSVFFLIIGYRKTSEKESIGVKCIHFVKSRDCTSAKTLAVVGHFQDYSDSAETLETLYTVTKFFKQYYHRIQDESSSTTGI